VARVKIMKMTKAQKVFVFNFWEH